MLAFTFHSDLNLKLSFNLFVEGVCVQLKTLKGPTEAGHFHRYKVVRAQSCTSKVSPMLKEYASA